MEYYLAIKNEIVPFPATWMDLEIITYQGKQIRETQIYDIAYMHNLTNNINESVYKIEKDSQTQKTHLRLPRRKLERDKLGVWD